LGIVRLGGGGVSGLGGVSGRRRILLMRHGHVDYMSAEVRESRDPRIARLTALGQAQAEAAGAALADLALDVAVCSGLRRTRETAGIVLAAHPAAPVLEDDPGLEELHSGPYIAFQSREQLAAALTFSFEQAGAPGATFFPGGEAFASAQARAIAAIERLLARPGWSQALVVAHEGVNRLILSWMARAGLAGAVAFEQDLACINVLDFDLAPAADGSAGIERMMIKAVNVTPYAWVKAGLHLSSFEAIFSAAAAEDA
jgi:broad specificity phosphatase PhoE